MSNAGSLSIDQNENSTTVRAIINKPAHGVNQLSCTNVTTLEKIPLADCKEVLSSEVANADLCVHANSANAPELDHSCPLHRIDQSLHAEGRQMDDKNKIRAKRNTALSDNLTNSETGETTSYPIVTKENRQAEKRTTASDKSVMLPVSYYSDDKYNLGKKSKRVCQENQGKSAHSFYPENDILETKENEIVITQEGDNKRGWLTGMLVGNVQVIAETHYQKKRTIDSEKRINLMESTSGYTSGQQKQNVKIVLMDTSEANNTGANDEIEDEYSDAECDVDLDVIKYSGMGTMCSDDGHKQTANANDRNTNAQPLDQVTLPSSYTHSTFQTSDCARLSPDSNNEIGNTSFKSWYENKLRDSGFIDMFSSSLEEPQARNSAFSERDSDHCELSGQNVGPVAVQTRSDGDDGVAGKCSSKNGIVTDLSETFCDGSFNMPSCSSTEDVKYCRQTIDCSASCVSAISDSDANCSSVCVIETPLPTECDQYFQYSNHSNKSVCIATASTKNSNCSSVCAKETFLPSECLSACVNVTLPYVSLQYHCSHFDETTSVGEAYIICLHYPLLIQILSHLSVYQLLRVVPRVCRYWHLASRDRDLWVNVNLRNQHRLTDEYIIQLLSRSAGHTRHLNLSDCHLLLDVSVQQVLSTNPALVALKLIRCFNLTDEAFSVTPISRHTRLRKLYLDGCSRLTDRAVQMITNLFPNLECLHLNQCGKVTDKALKLCAINCPRLTELQLDHCTQVTDAGLGKIARHCHGMQNLNLMSCGISDGCGIHIAKMMALTHLDLSNLQRLSPETVIYVARHCQLIQCLNVSLNTTISDHCVEQVAMALPRLKRLYCVCCSITDAGLEAIAKHCPCLESIDIGWCLSVTDSGIRVVSHACKRLEYFGLIRCDRITTETIDELVVEYPRINYSTFLLDSKRLLERARREGCRFDMKT